jgi:hypothetical protein
VRVCVCVCVRESAGVWCTCECVERDGGRDIVHSVTFIIRTLAH